MMGRGWELDHLGACRCGGGRGLGTLAKANTFGAVILICYFFLHSFYW